MIAQLLIPVALVLDVVGLGGMGALRGPWIGPGQAQAQARAQPIRAAAPAPTPAAAPDASRAEAARVARQVTDRAAAGVTRLLAQRRARQASKATLERTYQEQLRELDRLKRSRASWRRDRLVAGMKAQSQATAQKLSRVDAELRVIDGQVRAQRQALLAAIDRELAVASTAARRAALQRMRAPVAAALRPPPRKIILPDDSLDRLADPEELAEQIALIQQAERELRRERERLRQREERYARMSRLRDQRERASEMARLDGNEVRRTTGRPDGSRASSEGGGTGGVAGDAEDGAAPPGDPDPDPGAGADFGDSGGDSGFEQSSIILADVVDSTTIDALRRAGRSQSPKARAEAAGRARKQVESRLERLRRSRQLIQQHLRKLRAR